ncbi:MAG: excalibur calcium-binding domain-containing protein, partial [Defluviicoccus sp.]|nr:excalibur calcium-binding domain-containing protein [Defluviicoccus sp.]
YGLSVDRREAAALERVLAGCGSTAMNVTAPGGTATAPREAPAASSDALSLYDHNRNGRITCKEARRHGIAPVPRGHPAYTYMYDRDGDGVVCE